MGSDTIYRFEHAKTGRAGCANKACKNQEIKIQKGEPRMGVLFTLPDGHQSWSWKHWGCVTPAQIKNIQDNVEGLDLDTDLDILDGWEELAEEFQGKIKQAIRDGHVADEDWRGSPELNRPGMKGINKRRTPKKSAEPVERDQSDASPSKPHPKKKAATKKRKADAEQSDDAKEEPAPRARKRTSKKKTKVESDVSDEAEEKPTAKKATKSKPKSARAIKAEEHFDEEVEETAPKKVKSRAKAAKAVKEEENLEEEAPISSARAKRATRSKNQPAPEPVEAHGLEDAEEEPEEAPKRSRAKNVKKKADDTAESASRLMEMSTKEEETDADEKVPNPAPAKAKKGRKVKKEHSSEPEPDPTLDGETEPEAETAAEPVHPVVPAVDGPADIKVNPSKRGRKIKKGEVVDTIETESPAMPARTKKEHIGKKGVKAEAASDGEEAAVNATAEAAVPAPAPALVKKETTGSKVSVKTEAEDTVETQLVAEAKKTKAKGRGRKAKKEAE